MKLGCEIYFLREKFGTEKSIRLMKEAGFDYVDMNFDGLEDVPEFLNDHIGYAKNIKSALDKYGLACEQAHAHYCMRPSNKFSTSDELYAALVKSIEAAAILGAKYIVFHSITVPNTEKDISFTGHNLAFFKSLEPYCEKFNIKIAIENNYVRDEKCKCYRSKLGTPAELSSFIRSLNSPWFAACIDVGHAALVGWEPQDFIRAMDRELVKAVHIHDVNYLRDCHVMPFTSDLNWAEIISALKDIGYDGNFNLECGLFYRSFPDELVPNAMTLVHSVGRYLISELQK